MKKYLFFLIAIFITVNVRAQQDSLVDRYILMDEVYITDKYSGISIKNGEVEVDLQHFVKGTEESALDVLKRIPGIFVDDASKTITYHKLPIRFKLNGMNQSNVYVLLQSMPAHLLKTLTERRAELCGEEFDIKRPILDITLNKKQIEGYVGSVGGNYARTKFDGNRYTGNGYVMFMYKGLYISLTESYNAETKRGEMSYDSTWHINGGRYYANETFTDMDVRKWGNNINVAWNTKNAHQLSLNFNYTRDDDDPSSRINSFDAQRVRTEYLRANNYYRNYYSGNITYQTNRQKRAHTLFSYSYINNQTESVTDYLNRYQDTVVSFAQNQRFVGQQHYGNWKLVVKGLNNKLVLNAGASVNYGATDNSIGYDRPSTLLQTDKTDYKELNVMPNVSLTYTISKKHWLTARVRSEYTRFTLNEQNFDGVTDNSWLVMPDATWVFKPYANYNSTIRVASEWIRPSYTLLSPRVEYITDKHYKTGNSELEPQKLYQFVWQQTFKQQFVLILGMDSYRDIWKEVLLNRGNDVLEETNMNAINMWAANVEAQVSFSLANDKLNITLDGSYSIGRAYDIHPEVELRNREYGYSKVGIDIAYNPTEALSLTARCDAFSKVKACDDDRKAWLTHSLRAQYLCGKKRNVTLSMVMMNPFNDVYTQRQSQYINTIIYRNNYEPRYIRIGLSWQFKGGKDMRRPVAREDVNREIQRFD
ncbi:MAG: outer membrane beta-barrel protein [Marinifilaceae bacterium]